MLLLSIEEKANMKFEDLSFMLIRVGTYGLMDRNVKIRNLFPNTKIELIENPDEETERFLYEFDANVNIDFETEIVVDKVTNIIVLSEDGYRGNTCYTAFIKYCNKWYMMDTMDGTIMGMTNFTLKQFRLDVKELEKFLDGDDVGI